GGKVVCASDVEKSAIGNVPRERPGRAAIADLQRCAAADRRGRDAWLVVAGEDQRPGNNLKLPGIGVVPRQSQRARPDLVELGARRTAGDRASQRPVVAVGVEDGIAGTNRQVAARGEVRKKL